MIFNLNEFLMAVSFTLDFVEMDILGVASNHGKRTAYIALRIAQEIDLKDEEIHDVVALAMLHDNGLSSINVHGRFLKRDPMNIRNLESVKEHCIIGEDNIKDYPFFTDVKGSIKYHHENYDGTGNFNLKAEEIPLMAQIIRIADLTDATFNFGKSNNSNKEKIIKYINDQENKIFSQKLVQAFNNISKDKNFWANLQDDNLKEALKKNTPQFSKDLSLEEIKKITSVFSKIVDSKSHFTKEHSRGLVEKVKIMADYYKKSHEEKMKLIIAADLHDIGKLAIPNEILDSPRKLTFEEFELMKKHVYYTRIALQEIKGFEDINEWASNHHEKLNGMGYPFGKTEKDLDFNSRLMTCLDIYQALTEERPYRKGLVHKEAMKILYDMYKKGLIDGKITEDIDNVFGEK
ncbi:HD-GYP domain-containing protein [Clostridium isatidis]|uniref:HD family phosphohydrolase n=1 Tax=Clostridium isatidis TaxID=182773 RepID=A0A343JB80_9CLOT|nr:HD domain-containing phosphohydrolase [Clostridium isatidis]ASW42788.1 HD family phosphohydrolase [Clostridium isatidis]